MQAKASDSKNVGKSHANLAALSDKMIYQKLESRPARITTDAPVRRPIQLALVSSNHAQQQPGTSLSTHIRCSAKFRRVILKRSLKMTS